MIKASIVFLGLILSLQVLASVPLKVLTLNVFAKPDPGQKKSTTQRMEEICRVIKASNYDVVMLQEIWMVKYRKILRNCGYPYIMDQKNFKGVKRELDLGSGLLILSRYPFTQSMRFKLPHPTGLASFFLHGESLARKSLYLAEIEVKGQKIWLANTHLVANYCDNEEWYNCTSYEKSRRTQIEFISRVIDVYAKGEPAIFGGDLNMGEKKIARDRVWDEMDKLFPGFTQGEYDHSISTFSFENLFNRGLHDPGKIDHLFGSDHFEVQNAQVTMNKVFSDRKGNKRQYSDHYGWSADFTLHP